MSEFARMLREAIEANGAAFVERLRAQRAARQMDAGHHPIDYAAGAVHVLSVMSGIPAERLRFPARPLSDLDIERVARLLEVPEEPLIAAAEAERTSAHRVADAADVIAGYASYDGGHHKQWVFDQTLRAMLGPVGYAAWVAEYNSNPDHDDWDEGIAP